MSTYFIGDIHGCYDELMMLLKKIKFNADADRLIFTGDLINRGPKSLEVMRFIKGLGEQAQMVLGNHDISFIAYAEKLYHGRGTDFPKLYQARDSEKLLHWLRRQPLLVEDKQTNSIVVHAGIPPRWSLAEAKIQAKKAEKKLQSQSFKKYLSHAYKKAYPRWHEYYDKYDKFRYRLNGFTRMRYCDIDGEPNFRDKCPLGQQAEGLEPWFERRQKKQHDGQTQILFGHWAALGYYRGKQAICLDSGCAWGGRLTAVCLSKYRFKKTQVSSLQKKR